MQLMEIITITTPYSIQRNLIMGNLIINIWQNKRVSQLMIINY